MRNEQWMKNAAWKVEGERMTWVHFESPTLKEIDVLATQLKVPKDYLSAVLDPDEVARAENLNVPGVAKNLILLYPTENIDTYQHTVYRERPLSIVLLKDTIVTCVQHTPAFMEKIHKRYEAVKNALTQEHLVLEICWEISFEFIKDLRKIDTWVKDMEAKLRSSKKNDTLYRMVSLTRSLVNIDTALKANALVYESLETLPVMNLPASKSLLRDVRVENGQALKMGHSYYEMLKELREIYSGIISSHLNSTMEVLTSLTIILTIPTIVGGIWGMNVALPFEKHPYGFWIITGITIVSVLLAARWLRKKNMM